MKPLTTTYFGPISWYKQLACATEPVYIEACENLIKQTERSRCRIMTANGVQTLSVPVSLSKPEPPKPGTSLKPEPPKPGTSLKPEPPKSGTSLKPEPSKPGTSLKPEPSLGASASPSLFCDQSQNNHGNIRSVRISDHDNWRKLHWQALCSAYGNSPFFEFYADDIKPFFEPNWKFLFDYNLSIINKVCELLDIHPDLRLTEQYQHIDAAKHLSQTVICDKSQIEQPSYYQVFQSRFGFVPDLSILDLLFNMGPESILYLMK